MRWRSGLMGLSDIAKAPVSDGVEPHDLETGSSLRSRRHPFRTSCRPSPRLPRERFSPYVNSSHPVSANSGHSATVLQAVKFDPKEPLRARLRRSCRRASSERRVVLGAISPSQSGDVDAVAHEIVGALLDVSRHANVALDRSVLGLNAFPGVHRRPKPGRCRVTHSLTRGLFPGVAVESSAIPEVM
jgi:hypothetical protein